MLQFSTQNKLRINLCCNFSHKTKFGSTYVAIFHTKQTSDQPTLQLSWHNKIRINLCCNFSHKTKFGSTYVAIFHTKRLRLQTTFAWDLERKKPREMRLACLNEDLLQPKLIHIIMSMPRQIELPCLKSKDRLLSWFRQEPNFQMF